MNYRAELRAHGFDRALKFNADNKSGLTFEQIVELAEEIGDYLYIPEKDIDSHLKTLLPLIVQANDLEKTDNLILELQQIRAEMAANIIKPRVN